MGIFSCLREGRKLVKESLSQKGKNTSITTAVKGEEVKGPVDNGFTARRLSTSTSTKVVGKQPGTASLSACRSNRGPHPSQR